jgi:formate dehydrogenase iron-sulfur subunit
VQEAERTAHTPIVPGRSYGFFTDTSVCIGCKACEVACKEWNELPAEDAVLTGESYDNTSALGATTWRHVTFVEKISGPQGRATEMAPFQSNWLMASDVCKHCANAPCLEVCPTGAIFRTEFDTVVVQGDICNGCGYCVPACPFGVVELSKADGKAHKCTLCYDRMKGGFEPACAKACPTDSIQFGEVDELTTRAEARVERLHALGQPDAYLYGTPGGPGATGGLRRLNAFFLLLDRPEVYGLPATPSRGAERIAPGLGSGLLAMGALAVAALVALRKR